MVFCGLCAACLFARALLAAVVAAVSRLGVQWHLTYCLSRSHHTPARYVSSTLRATLLCGASTTSPAAACVLIPLAASLSFDKRLMRPRSREMSTDLLKSFGAELLQPSRKGVRRRTS